MVGEASYKVSKRRGLRPTVGARNRKMFTSSGFVRQIGSINFATHRNRLNSNKGEDNLCDAKLKKVVATYKEAIKTAYGHRTSCHYEAVTESQADARVRALIESPEELRVEMEQLMKMFNDLQSTLRSCE